MGKNGCISIDGIWGLAELELGLIEVKRYLLARNGALCMQENETPKSGKSGNLPNLLESKRIFDDYATECQQ
jgi:hypothetical protein